MPTEAAQCAPAPAPTTASHWFAPPALKAVAGKQFKKLKGEDTSDVLETTIAHEETGVQEPFLFALIADGHGGQRASHYVARNALERISQRAKCSSRATLDAAAVEVFRELHDEIRASPNSTSGTTLTVVAINLARLSVLCWNVGDSSVILASNPGSAEAAPSVPDAPDADGRRDGDPSASFDGKVSMHQHRVVVLSEDHRLGSNADEMERVRKKGAKLGQAIGVDGQPRGPLRAWPGGLAVARGLGDADCGEVVSPHPACSEHSLPTEGGAVILCTDGVWDAPIEPHEAAACVLDGSSASADKAAAHLVRRAVARRGLRDDTTALVILLEPASRESRATGAEISPDQSPEKTSRRVSILSMLVNRLSFTPSPEACRSPPDASTPSGDFPRRDSDGEASAGESSPDSPGEEEPLSASPPAGDGIGAPLLRCDEPSIKGGTIFSEVDFSQAVRHSRDAKPAFWKSSPTIVRWARQRLNNSS